MLIWRHSMAAILLKPLLWIILLLTLLLLLLLSELSLQRLFLRQKLVDPSASVFQMVDCPDQSWHLDTTFFFQLLDACLDHDVLLLGRCRWVQSFKLVLPMTKLLQDLLDVSLNVDAVTGSIQNAPCSVALDQSSQWPFALLLTHQALFDDLAEKVSSPDFLNQSCAKSSYLRFKLLLVLLSGLW